LGNAFSPNFVLAGDTVASLKKQVTQLTVQVKSLTSKVKSKDQEIAKLKKENATFKANVATASKTKVSYKGLVKTGAITYKNNVYLPVSYVKDVFGIPVTYDRKADINYVGLKPEGNYMSDILKPYSSKTEITLNEKMNMGGEPFYKGYAILSGGVMEGHAAVSFNLGKKYSNIKGKLGIDDNNYVKDNATISIYGDNELINTIELFHGDLPTDLNLDVMNINKLTITIKADTYRPMVINFADVVIR
jgi:hypothetical protein